MAFTDKQAKAKAQQIFDRFGQLIHDACVGTGVRESFLAGFTGVEAGIDRNGQIRPSATRFEPGVYRHLIAVRDGFLHSYDNITAKDLASMTDDAIHNLATSWGCTQIMGWHLVHNLKGTIEDLRDINQHFHFTVQLLKIVGGHFMRDGDLASVLHIWNTGHANGKTYHEDYVTNALKVAKFYEGINVGNPFAGAITTETSAADPGSSGREAAGPAAAESALDDPAGGSNNSNDQEQPSTPDDAGPGFFTRIWTQIDSLGDRVQTGIATFGKFQLPTSGAPSGLGTRILTGLKLATGYPAMVLGMIFGHWEWIAGGAVLVIAAAWLWNHSRNRNNPSGATAVAVAKVDSAGS